MSRKNHQIENLKQQLESSKQETRRLEANINKIFTSGHIHLLKNRGLNTDDTSRQHWNENHISNAITLYSASPRGYKFLKRRGLPLPHRATLNRWASKLNIIPGILEPVLQLLKNTNEMTPLQKLCVLSFDEMKIRRTFCYDSKTDTTLAPTNYVQVGMLRGLASKWKQPVYYNYDCAITKDIVFDVLKALKNVGYIVVALVNDLGGTKRILMPFQKGILQSTRALKMLFADIKTKYNAKFILRYNLNQDVLENFFGLICCRGGLHDHPDQQEFKYRLRSYLLGTNEGALREEAMDELPHMTYHAANYH